METVIIDEAIPDAVDANSKRRAFPVRRVFLYASLVAIAIFGLAYGGTRPLYTQQLVAVAMIYAILAVSLDVVWGYAGILSMAHAVFFGLGAYAVGLFQVKVSTFGIDELRPQHWWNYPAGIVAGILVVVVVAAVVGALAFYGKGTTPFYVAVVTLALTVTLSTVLVQVQRVGGQQGLSGFPISGPGPNGWYLICAGTLVVTLALAAILVRSDYGVLLRAIRDNEIRCRFLGYDVALVKTCVFAGSAAFAAIAGALYAGYIGFVSPPFVGFTMATNCLIWVAVGGRATLIGPILGALAVNLIGSNLSARFPDIWTLIVGCMFVLVVVFIPDGVFPGLTRLGRKAAQTTRRTPRAIRQTRPMGRALQQTQKERSYSAIDRAAMAMQIRGLYRSFGGLNVLRGVDLDVRRGELLCIVGPNGAGKTTLLGVISDGSVRHRGEVVLGATNGTVSLSGKEPKDVVRAGVGRKFQNPNLFETLTTAETVLLSSRKGRIPAPWRRTKTVELRHEVVEILRSTGLWEAENSVVRDLPHGLKQALEVAMTVALEPAILLLDEPTAGLTQDERRLIGDLLRDLVTEGFTIVLIEHDFDFVRRIADRIAVLHDGRVLELGTVNEVAESELVKRVYLGAAHEA